MSGSGWKISLMWIEGYLVVHLLVMVVIYIETVGAKLVRIGLAVTLDFELSAFLSQADFCWELSLPAWASKVIAS